MRLANIIVPLLVALAAGCTIGPVGLSGSVRGARTNLGSAAEPLYIQLSSHSELSLNRQPLNIPAARESLLLGVALGDPGRLPAAWQPRHLAGRSGALVLGLDQASPLAIAGVRPFDLIETVNGQPVAYDTAIPALLAAADKVGVPALGWSATVTGVSRSGAEPFVVEVAIGPVLPDRSSVAVPLLFQVHDSPHGSAWGLGPFDLLFAWHDALAYHWDTDSYRGEHHWDFLFVGYGQLGSAGYLRLFWGLLEIPL